MASQEGDHIRQRAHYVDIIFGPQTLHRLPEMINSVRGNRSPVVDISFPEIENSIACQSRAPKGRPPLSRLWKVAINTAPTAWCRIPAEKKLAVRATISCLKSPSWRRRACVRSICWGRTLTPGAVRIRRHHRQLCRPAAPGRCHRRHRPHSLHHQPPDRIYRRYHRRLSRYAGAGELPAPAGAEWLRPCAEPNGTHPYRAGV